jgi:hypothetical protein
MYIQYYSGFVREFMTNVIFSPEKAEAPPPSPLRVPPCPPPPPCLPPCPPWFLFLFLSPSVTPASQYGSCYLFLGMTMPVDQIVAATGLEAYEKLRELHPKFLKNRGSINCNDGREHDMMWKNLTKPQVFLRCLIMFGYDI